MARVARARLVTAATTFYLAEIYAHFSKALVESERPTDLNPLEMEQYEMAIEEQAYPFEDKAISIHQNNLELISMDIYNTWIDKSMKKLAVFMPARYDKPEMENDLIVSPDTFKFEIDRPKSTEKNEPLEDTALTKRGEEAVTLKSQADDASSLDEGDTVANVPEEKAATAKPEQKESDFNE